MGRLAIILIVLWVLCGCAPTPRPMLIPLDCFEYGVEYTITRSPFGTTILRSYPIDYGSPLGGAI